MDADHDLLNRCRRETRRALPAAADDLVEELAQDLALRWQRARGAGATVDDADDRMRRELAGWQGRSTSRQPRIAVWSGWGAEARHALRTARVRPGFTLALVFLTAVAATATLAVLAVTYGLLWRPLPYPDGDRLAVLWQVRHGEEGQVSLPDYRDLTSGSLFEAAAVMSGGRGSLRVGDRIERVNALQLELPGFAMLGAKPALGRLLNAGDSGRPSALISHRLWRAHLGADPDVVGRALWLSGTTLTVVGVLEAGFDFELPVGRAFTLEDHDIWTLPPPDGPFAHRRDVSTFEALVRLPPGMPLDAVQRSIDQIARRLAETHASTNRGRGFRVAPLRDEVIGRFRQPLLLAGVGAALALAIVLANLVTLAGVRLSDRRSELAIRHALGAGGYRLRRQLLTEYAMAVAVGTAAGYGCATWIVSALVAADVADLPRPGAILFDLPVRVAALAVGAVIVMVLTFLPMRSSRDAVALHAGERLSRGSRRVRRMLVAGELALSLALAATGVLLGLSLVRLVSQHPGFDPHGAVAARVSAYALRYPALADVEAFIASVLRAVQELPGITDVGAGSTLPLGGPSPRASVMREGESVTPGARLSAGWQFVTPGYFGALGMNIRQGRDFGADDRVHDGHVAIVNETLARTLFPGQRAVGRRIAVGGSDAQNDWHEIVGVVADVRHSTLGEAPQARVYDLFGEHWGRTLYVAARTRSADDSTLIDGIRRAVAALDPEAPLFEAATMPELVRRSAAPHRLSTMLAAGLALAAVVLALAGIYAIVAVSVAERTREIGIRAALGARPGDLGRLVLREGASTAICGGAIGSVFAVGASRLVQSDLFHVSSLDIAVVIWLVALALIAAAVAATIPCARRAALSDPLAAIRPESRH
jgi:predicted permease